MHIPASTYRIMRWALVVLMAVIVVLLMIEGTWGLRLYHHPVFIALVVAMLVPLGIVSVRRRRQVWTGMQSWQRIYAKASGR